MYSPQWTNSYAQLPDSFYSRVRPTPFTSPSRLIHFNAAAADLLGMAPDELSDPQWLEWLSGHSLPGGGDPLAMLYAGHQFGQYVPQLGDGRAIMLGEISLGKRKPWTAEGMTTDRIEIQLKGSGQTPYSRQGDGRAVLRSTIREYLCSEAMHGLGIPTTRALAIIGSDDEVYRERAEPGAILTRLAPSHVRFGSFEVFFYRDQFDRIRTLADYVLSYHYPDLKDASNPYLALFSEVMQRTARLIAQWQAVGFAHGVMNSDNMSILGLTLDYGPFGFMQAYQPGYICNHSDHGGRYAFDQQPEMGLFNLSCLAQALLPLLDDKPDKGAEIAKDVLAQYQPLFIKEYAALMRQKLGLVEAHEEDQSLLSDLLNLMEANQVDYTILFRRLANFNSWISARTLSGRNEAIRDLFLDRNRFDAWAIRYARRLQKEKRNDAERKVRIRKVNPKYILRNHLAEIAIRKAEDDQDYSEIDKLFTILQNPFDEWPEYEDYAEHPPEWAEDISVSCSS